MEGFQAESNDPKHDHHSGTNKRVCLVHFNFNLNSLLEPAVLTLRFPFQFKYYTYMVQEIRMESKQ